MRICIVLEGCYPYVRGGVSSWVHNYITAQPQNEFVLWTIAALSSDKGKFKYQLPPNVVEIREVFLDAALQPIRGIRKFSRLNTQEREALKKLILCESPGWGTLFNCFSVRRVDPVRLLMSGDFLMILRSLFEEKYPNLSYTDTFHTFRSMFLPICYLMGRQPPQADLYHSLATGYGGLLAMLGAWRYNRPMVLSEHGIYTREREEEILRARWVQPAFKSLWISMFYMLSRGAYQSAHRITSLFAHAREIQIEIGAPEEKCRVVRNGIHVETFGKIPQKLPDGFMDVGAIVRIAPIKDIKTMIYAFTILKARYPASRLHILGDVDDPEYAQECHELVEQLQVKDIIFTGNTDVRKYMEKLDISLLTSISEGQPLSVLEAMAAGRPCVVTDVGSCRELVLGGPEDKLGPAGICVQPMQREALAQALERLCRDGALRDAMGQAGRARTATYYGYERMLLEYDQTYQEARKVWQASGLN